MLSSFINPMDNPIVPPQQETVTPQQTSPQPEVITETQDIQPPKKSKKTLLIILISILSFFGLIGVIFLITTVATKEPLQASNNFLVAFTSQDVQTVYDLTSTKFQETVTQEEFQAFQEKYKVMGLDQAKVTGKSIVTSNNSTIATFTYSLEYESEEWIFETVMVKNGDQWLLQSISFE